MQTGHLRLILILGILSCVGPFAIDMYLPAMPSVAADLSSDAQGAQLSITAFFLSFGLAQLVYGPVADHAGRKMPLYVGLSIFAAASIGCALSPDIFWLASMRFLQGLGAAVVMVIPRAVVRDVLTGTAATRMMAALMLVISVSPMLAPLFGSAVLAFADWRAIFWILFAAALASLAITAFLLPETLTEENRVPFSLRSMVQVSRMLLADRKFVLLTLVGGFGFSTFFIFLASASFVYTQQYGLSPTGFSLAFAANAFGFFSASQLAGPAGDRFGMLPLVKGCAIGFASVTTLLCLAFWLGVENIGILIGGLMVANAFLGFIIPTTMVMALDDHGKNAGMASSLGGTIQMLAGVGAATLAGFFFNATALPMLVAIMICALISATLALAIRPQTSFETGEANPS